MADQLSDYKQRLVIFGNVINGEDLILNKNLFAELNKLGDYVFGKAKYFIEHTDKDEELQDWCMKVLNKTISNGYGMSYKFKTPIEIIAEDYSGPLTGWLEEPEGCFDDSIIVLTCNYNGLFKNPRYVVGVLIDKVDLDRLVIDL